MPEQNPHEFFEVLDRIVRALTDHHYLFVNVSLGPHLPVEDDDVHAWTPELDDRLARSVTLATIATSHQPRL
jgi:hypothetical protein